MQTLFIRALRICSEDDLLTAEINHIFSSFKRLAYPDWVLKQALSKTKRSHFSKNTLVNNTEKKLTQKIILPYVPMLENLKPQLRKFNTEIIFKHKNKLSNQIVYNKPKSLTHSGVYKIPCKSCQKQYIGETGRDLDTRISEHKKDIKPKVIQNKESGVASHVFNTGHSFDFENAKIVHDCDNKTERHIVESVLICLYSKQDLTVKFN